jgi:hypothetical protein
VALVGDPIAPVGVRVSKGGRNGVLIVIRGPYLKGKRTQGNRLLGNPPTTDARQMPHISDGGGRAKNGWRWTGADLTRKDADRFVTGTIDYAADLIRPGGARLQV